MINFSCNNCGRSFTVPDEAAGRRGICKVCGATMVIPTPDAPKIVISFPEPPRINPAGPAPPPVPPAVYSTITSREFVMPSKPEKHAVQPVLAVNNDAPGPGKQKPPMRIRRLLADADQVRHTFYGFPLIQVLSMIGNPPDSYQIQYNVRGLTRGPNGSPVYREQHIAEIQLTSEYPRMSPKCKMLTPIFHPNIEPAVICMGDHWTAGERLIDLIVRIGEMIAYQAYNIKSPLDGEAAMWADQNSRYLPVDARNLCPAGMD